MPWWALDEGEKNPQMYGPYSSEEKAQAFIDRHPELTNASPKWTDHWDTDKATQELKYGRVEEEGAHEGRKRFRHPEVEDL